MGRRLFELNAYLDRIGIAAPARADSAGLAELQRAHRLVIPFENLDILLGRGIDVAPDAIFAKLVTQRRGGYCFEQNGLFGQALTALGFTTRPLMARVWLMDPPATPGRSHVILHVTLSGVSWIADAGFGGGYAPPMPLVADRIVEDGDVRHRLRRDAEHGWMLERDGGEGWTRQFSFTLDPVYDADIVIANHWTSTAPVSRFTLAPVLNRTLPDGDVSLTGRRLVRRRSGGGTQREIGDAAAYRATLAEVFGLDLSEAEVAALGLFA